MTVDPSSGLLIGDPSRIPALLTEKPGIQDIKKALSDMILSASGWRKVFAPGGNEEDSGEELVPADIMLAALIGMSYGDFLIPRLEKQPSDICIAVGLDSRPTGSMLAEAFMRPLLERGVQLRFLFIAAAPEIMAYARLEEDVDGFAYISASHNPVGHNGFKFGLSRGGVLDGESVAGLTRIFLSHCDNLSSADQAYEVLRSDQNGGLEDIFESVALYKSASLASYRKFSQIVLADSFEETTESERLSGLTETISAMGTGIIGELNGSARTLSIDKEFFGALGVNLRIANGKAGQISHGIVPEGPNLNECRELLQQAHMEDSSFILGYVPDNDGDRGNLVYINARGRAEILEAQTVFALVALAESAWLEYSGQLSGNATKAAIAVNGPTSMRIDEIASAFNIEVFRAEVGEANLVGLGRELRQRGYTVRLMGEGSNGGNITHPAAVRDPLNSIGSILKLLALREDQHRPGLFEIWCRRRSIGFHKDFVLADIIDSLPTYLTTSSYEDRALLNIRATDHKALKSAYEKLFIREIKSMLPRLNAKYGLTAWEELNTEGSCEKRGFGGDFRSGSHKGGLKILFYDKTGESRAYLWMRGSGTEPVFRVLVDVRGHRPAMEAELLDWHKNLIMRADESLQ